MPLFDPTEYDTGLSQEDEDRISEEGVQAYLDSKGRLDSPYPEGSVERTAWLNGYEDPS